MYFYRGLTGGMLSKEKENSQENEKFYVELDRDREHGSCCTCYSLSLFFIFILVIAIIGSFFIYKQVTSGGLFPFSLNNKSSMTDLINKIDQIKSDSINQTEISISEDDLNLLFSGGFNLQNFILKDVQTSIGPDSVIVYGNLVKPFSSKTVVSLVPTIENGKIKFVLQSVEAGKLKIPKFLFGQIEKVFNSAIDAKMSLIYDKVTITDASLQDRKIILKGELK